jgi:hypothetical protein
MQNAEQQGPEHATKQVWVVRPELREQYGLPAEVPADVQEKVAASVKAPKKKLGALNVMHVDCCMSHIPDLK